MQLPFTFSFSFEKFRVDKLLILGSIWFLKSYLDVFDYILFLCRLAVPHLSSDSHSFNRPGSSSRFQNFCHLLGK